MANLKVKPIPQDATIHEFVSPYVYSPNINPSNPDYKTITSTEGVIHIDKTGSPVTDVHFVTSYGSHKNIQITVGKTTEINTNILVA